MRQLKEILRQKWLLQRSHRAIARSVGVSAGTVGDAVVRVRRAGLNDWASIAELAEAELVLPRTPADLIRSDLAPAV
jgi:hypothetical protein